MSRVLDIVELAEMSRKDLVLLLLDQQCALDRLRRKSRAHRKQLREMQSALERKNLALKRYTDQPIIIHTPGVIAPYPQPDPYRGYEITCSGSAGGNGSSAPAERVTHTGGRVR